MNGLWRQLRAVLVALHILAILALATPSPGAGMRRSAWKDPTVQAELAAWTGRLNALGWTVSQAELESRLWDFATGWESRRDGLLKPFSVYAEYTGAGQSWRMFVAPHRFPTALHIDVREAGIWRPVYIERSSEYTWLGWALDSDRFRSVIFRLGWSHYRKQYEEFGDWVALQAARDFPDADAVRTRMYRARSPSPEEVREGRVPEGTFEQVRVMKLDVSNEVAP